ncbi:cell wall hydrolase [Clostridium botulinum]|uniref:Cell wall hydrolase n=1 Tax=Clostridium botulinum C/D str. DC5 TaxID=1443128 RepID=A0A0A0I972_CLOBO|nr:cell wall hydrolase [Clostridium botulinum]KEI01685.1 cell wall hydrolase [Clostridium botulinum C/D str. BKT75002]KEI09931.1 cell wall hydrolase [Clostridium botulinum C/D str. BKT2873]KGM94490.1 cell wall hydrolase [Clostridium botulinum D str. CCUG 7971]KGM97098.1 cell wall hydrolase [Clostridium botulinum C/D str. DC5]KOC48081.1 cell wall hydrolase [Clostridium botulinum]
MAYSNRELLARIIKCEAGGEGEDGMKAVATVIMNRVRIPYGEYQRICQGDIRKVIYQEGQFDCVRSTLGGQPNPQTIWANPPEQIHYDIADWALAGNRLYNVGYSLWYFNPFAPSCPYNFPYNGTGSFQVRVVQHCFYNPTELYAET